MFRQLLARMPDLEQLGPAIWTLPPGVAVSVVGPRSIPVTFTPGRGSTPDRALGRRE